MSRADKFFDDYPTETPACWTCVHKSPLGPTCTAFPRGIPMPILTGEHQHREPYEGDHGVQWEPATAEE